MPHLRINYSGNLPSFDASWAMTKVVEALSDTGEFPEARLKARAYRAEVFTVGTEPMNRGFVAAELTMLPGRDPALKKQVSQRVCETIAALGNWPADMEVQISCSISELDTDGYTKIVVGDGA